MISNDRSAAPVTSALRQVKRGSPPLMVRVVCAAAVYAVAGDAVGAAAAAAASPTVAATRPPPASLPPALRGQAGRSRAAVRVPVTALLDMRPKTEVDGEEDAVQTGPEGCVSIWTTKASHCIIRTSCKGIDITHYTFSLVCADHSGGRTRHNFGTGSFDSTELFDTLIICKRCEPDSYDDRDFVAPHSKEGPKPLNESVRELAEEVSELKADMANVTVAVRKLQAKVLAEQQMKAPVRSAADTDAAPAAMAALPLRHRRYHHHRSLQRQRSPAAATGEGSGGLRQRRQRRQSAAAETPVQRWWRRGQPEMTTALFRKRRGRHVRKAPERGPAAAATGAASARWARPRRLRRRGGAPLRHLARLGRGRGSSSALKSARHTVESNEVAQSRISQKNFRSGATRVAAGAEVRGYQRGSRRGGWPVEEQGIAEAESDDGGSYESSAADEHSTLAIAPVDLQAEAVESQKTDSADDEDGNPAPVPVNFHRRAAKEAHDSDDASADEDGSSAPVPVNFHLRAAEEADDSDDASADEDGSSAPVLANSHMRAAEETDDSDDVSADDEDGRPAPERVNLHQRAAEDSNDSNDVSDDEEDGTPAADAEEIGDTEEVSADDVDE